MNLRALIVDDEPIARRVLREDLETLGGIEIVADADNGPAAVALIDRTRPDLVFLDLQMPGMTGFEVIRSLNGSGHMPVVVILTAYDQYAIQAFEVGAIDYLLKPVSQERLAVAVQRARLLRSVPASVAGHLAQIQEIASGGLGQPRLRKIVGRSGEEYLLLDAAEVFAFQADGDLVWIITANKKYLATSTLKALGERLRDTNFRRIHRNALVNMDRVRRMSSLSSQRWLITLGNNLEFVVSKRLAHNIREFLTW